MSRVLLVLIVALALAGAVFWLGNSVRTPRGARAASEAQESRSEGAPATLTTPDSGLPRDVADDVADPAEPALIAERVEPGPARESAATAKESELARASWIVGQVVLPAGTPADEDVFVVANGKDFADGSNHRVRAAPDGSFRVAFSEKSRTGWLQLEARYLYLDEVVRWRKGASAERVVLEPVLGGRITGRVLLPSGADPRTVVGKVELLTTIRQDRNSSRQETRSIALPADLGFAFDALDVEASYEVDFDGATCIGTSASVLLEAGKAHELALALRPGVRLAGRVTGEDGTPLAKVEISARSEANGVSWTANRYRSGSSKADGSFELGAFAGGDFELEASLGGYEPLELALGKLEEGVTRTGLELVLTHGNSIAGTVRWPDGSPAVTKLALIPASEQLDWDDWNETVEGASDASGRFQVTGLGPGPYRVQARATKTEEVTVKSSITGREHTKRKPVLWMAELPEVPPGTLALELTLSTGLALTGRAVDDQGLAVSGFRISAERVPTGNAWVARSEDERNQNFRDTDGDFVLAGFTPGEWTISATSSGHAEAEPVRVTFPSEGIVRLVLPREARISGAVLDPGGTPVVGALVHASFEQGRFAGRDSLSDRSSARGAFRIDGLVPGPVTLFAESTQGAPSEPLVLELAAGEERSGVVLRLRAGATILGQVLDASGRPEAGASVALFTANRHDLTTDADGRFEAHGLAAGEHDLSVDLRDGVRLAQQLTLAEGETKRVLVQAPSAGLVRLHGRVRAGGTEVDRGRVHAFPMDASEDVTRTDSSAQVSAGSYELRLPGAGRYALAVSVNQSLGWLSWRETIEVPAVDDYVFDVDLPLGRIGGRVTDARGLPLARIFVRSEPEQHEAGESGSGHALTGEDGGYELVIPAGRHTVIAGGERGPRDDGQSYAEVRTTGLVVVDAGRVEGVDFALVKGGSLEGIVRGPDGKLAKNANLWSHGPSGARHIGWAGEGSFHVAGLEPGTHWIGASQDTRTTRENVRVEIAAGETRRLELVLVQATRLHVRVTDANGALVGCDIEAVDATGRAALRQCGEKGEAWFGPLTEGRYTVRARRDEQLVVHEIELGGAEGERDLELAFD